MFECSGLNFSFLEFRANPSLMPKDLVLYLHLQIEKVRIQVLDHEVLRRVNGLDDLNQEYTDSLMRQMEERSSQPPKNLKIQKEKI